MLRKLFLVFLFCLFALQSVYAQEINLFQSEYVAGETFQAWVYDAMLSSSQISVLYNNTEISISPLLVEHNTDVFVYFDLPESLQNGSYTFVAGGSQVPFMVSIGSPVLRVKPPVVILDKDAISFSIELRSVEGAATVQVNSSDSALRPRRVELDVAADSSRSLFVDYDYADVQGDAEILLMYGLESYRIPILLIEEAAPVENVTLVEENVTEVPVVPEKALVFLVTENVSLTINYNESQFGDLKVQNILAVPVSNLVYRLTGNLADVVTLNVSGIETLNAGEIFVQRLWVNKANESSIGNYTGEVILENDQYSVALSLAVTVTNTTVSAPAAGGVITELNYTIVPIEGEALEEEGAGRGTIIIGVVLIIMLLILIILVALKLRQRQEKKFHEYIEETKKK